MHKFTFDIAHLHKYRNGELSPKEMHEIERAAHEDEMLMDILTGMELESKRGSDRSPLPAIRQQIAKRAQHQKYRKSLLYNRSLQIAASVVVVMTAAGILFWSPNNSKLQSESTIASSNQQAEGVSSVPVVPNKEDTVLDSTAATRTESNPNALSRHSEQQIASKSTSDRSLSAHEKHILAYAPTPNSIELSQEVSGTLNLGHPKHENDVIIINTEAQDSKSSFLAANNRKQPKSKVADTRVSSNPNTPLSSAQMRARLSTMGLDPQADFMSVQVIDRKSGKPLSGASVKDTKNDNVIVTDSDGRFSYATTSKKNLTINAVGYTSREITTESGVQTILLSPLDNGLDEFAENNPAKTSKSTPSNGMEAYMTYLRKEIAKLTNLPYDFTIQMELDKKGKPARVAILKSSDKNLNAKVIALLEKGPIWKRGTDWRKINLQLKSI